MCLCLWLCVYVFVYVYVCVVCMCMCVCGEEVYAGVSLYSRIMTWCCITYDSVSL